MFAAAEPSMPTHMQSTVRTVVGSLLPVALVLLFLVSGLPPTLHVPPSTTGSAAPIVLAGPSPGPDLNYTTYLGDVERTSSASDPYLNLSTAPRLGLLWSYNTTSDVVSQPVVQGAVTYVGSGTGYEYALNVSTGALLWKTFLGQAKNNSPCGVQGISSTATVVGSTLYVDGGYPRFYALNATTGKVEWSVPIGAGTHGFYDYASPLIYNNSAYLGISSECDLPLVPAGVLRVSLSTHSQIAYFNTSQPAPNGSSIWGSPALNPTTNTLFVATGNAYSNTQTPYAESILALNASTLALQGHWQIPPGETGNDKDFGTTPTIFTPPGGVPMLAAPNKNGYIYTLYQSNLTLAWSHLLCCQGAGESDVISSSYGGGLVYAVAEQSVIGGVPFNSSITAFNAATGTVVWQLGLPELSEYGWADPTFVNGVLLLADSSTLIAFNASDGAVLRTVTVPGDGFFIPAPVVANGEVLTASTEGPVYAFDLGLAATAAQSVPSGPLPLADSFSVSVLGGLPPYKYHWAFGTGATSSLADPSYTYARAGTFTATVTVTDRAGNVATSSVNVTGGAKRYYSLRFSEAGLPSGTNWSITYDGAGYSSTTSNVTLTEPNGTNRFSVLPPPGFVAVPAAGQVTIAGGVQTVAVAFDRPAPRNFTVTFELSGLPRGTAWSVSMNGGTSPSTASSISFTVPNGSFAYSIGNVGLYVPSPSGGYAIVSGANLTVPVAFLPPAYAIAMTETGLPPGMSWAIGVGRVMYTSLQSSYPLYLPNGTYAFAVTALAGYSASPAAGSVTVSGPGAALSITFAPEYALQFQETGLPGGTKWSVKVANTTESTTSSLLVFSEPNGSYSYKVVGVSGYLVSPVSGTAKVSGSTVTVALKFRAVYIVTVTESGLPTGTSWSIKAGGTTYTATTATISFTVANGTYSYSVGAAGYNASAASGSFTVNGAKVSLTESFTIAAGPVRGPVGAPDAFAEAVPTGRSQP